MSFGDGQAQSIGNIGYSKILYIADGTAIVNSDIDTDVIKTISPINYSDLEFERTTTTSDITIQKININAEIKYISSYVKKTSTYLPSIIEVSARSRQYYPSPSILKATCQVIDINDTNKYVMNYLVIDDRRINSYKLSVVSYMQKLVMNESKYVLSVDLEGQLNDNHLIPISIEKSVKVRTSDDYRVNFNPAWTLVENRVPYTRNGVTVIQPVTANVEDYKPPSTAPAFSGGGLKNFRLVIQKYSYMEQYLSFSTGTVVSITGLPQGMIFENGYLKGSPLMSGQFAISIIMDDNSALSGLLIVTQTPREL